MTLTINIGRIKNKLKGAMEKQINDYDFRFKNIRIVTYWSHN